MKVKTPTLIFALFISFMLFMPSASAKTYTDKNLGIRYTIPDEWEVVAISDVERFMSENNATKATIDKMYAEMNNFVKYGCTYVIIPDPKKNTSGSFFTIILMKGDSAENYTLEQAAKASEAGAGIKLTKYTNSKASYMFGYKEIRNLFFEIYLTLINNDKAYEITYIFDSSKYLTDEKVKNFIDTIEYNVRLTNQPSNEQSNQQVKDPTNSNETNGKITTNDGKGNVTTETITIGSNSNYFIKNILIKIAGTILAIIFAVSIAKGRKFSLISFFGWLLIAVQVIRCLFSNTLLITKDRIEFLYIVAYFLPGIIGLILLNKSDFKMSNSYETNNNVNNQMEEQKNEISNNVVNNQPTIENITIDDQETSINENGNVEIGNNMVSNINETNVNQINRNDN